MSAPWFDAREPKEPGFFGVLLLILIAAVILTFPVWVVLVGLLASRV